jgi:hypothetical protein
MGMLKSVLYEAISRSVGIGLETPRHCGGDIVLFGIEINGDGHIHFDKY